MVFSITSYRQDLIKYRMIKFPFHDYTNLRNEFVSHTALYFNDEMLAAYTNDEITVAEYQAISAGIADMIVQLKKHSSSAFIATKENYVKLKLIEYFDQSDNQQPYYITPRNTSAGLLHWIDGNPYDNDFDSELQSATLSSTRDDDVGRGLSGWYSANFVGAQRVSATYDDILGANYWNFHQAIRSDVHAYYDQVVIYANKLVNGESLGGSTSSGTGGGATTIINQIANTITSTVDFTLTALTNLSENLITNLGKISTDSIYSAQMLFSISTLIMNLQGMNMANIRSNMGLADDNIGTKTTTSRLTRNNYSRE